MILISIPLPETNTITDIGVLFLYLVKNLYLVLLEKNIMIFGYDIKIFNLVAYLIVGTAIIGLFKRITDL